MDLPPDFYRLYEGLPRQGPGSEAVTREALRRLGPLPPAPVVLDLGCGSGASTLVIARELHGHVVAVDNHLPFLRELERRAAALSLASTIEMRAADMATLQVRESTVDLIWSEGAIYLLGFEAGLRRFRPWLRAGGKLAVSECSWLAESPPPAIRAFWKAAYPAMGTVAVNCKRAQAAGFDIAATFVLPASAWWDEYYRPLLARAATLQPEAAANPALAAAIGEMRQEIALFERFGDCYGYVFYLCTRKTPWDR